MAEKLTQPPEGNGTEVEREDQWLRGLLRDHAPTVRVLLRTRYPTFNSSDIDDVVIVALTRFWSARHRYRAEKSSIRTFFCRIADSVALDILKCGWHHARRLEVAFDDRQIDCQMPTPHGDDSDEQEAALATMPGLPPNSQIIQDLRKIIDNLPHNYRTIVMADGCAPERVASAELLSRELEIPAATVRVYRNRAMNSIRSSLRKLGYHVP